MHRPFNNPKRLIVFFHDLVMAGATMVAALALRVGPSDISRYVDALFYMVPIFVAIAGGCFLFFTMYRGIWRFASIDDLIAIVKATSLAVLIFIPTMFLIDRITHVPRSMPIIHWVLLVGALGLPRLGYRLLRDGQFASRVLRHDRERIPIVLIGVNDRVELAVRALANDPQAAYRVVGIVTRKASRVGQSIHGVPVLGVLDDIPAIIGRLAAEGRAPRHLVLTDSVRDAPTARDALAHATALGLTVLRLPAANTLRPTGDGALLDLEPVVLDDLLGRAPVSLDLPAIAALLGGRRVLVTGAGGTIGAELVGQIAGHGPAELILADNSELALYRIEQTVRETRPAVALTPVFCDVRDPIGVTRLFRTARPDIVFHAAAMKHVPIVEANPRDGVLTNTMGTRHVADAALRHGAAAMVLISTDKAVNPTSVMGASKRLAEAYVQALDLGAARQGAPTRFMTVRFGNVLGSSGSVVPLFQRQLARGGPLTVTHPEISRYFMTVSEAVGLVLQAAAHGLGEDGSRGRILVIDMGEPVKIAHLARQLIQLAGLRPDRDVTIVFTGLRPGEKLREELFDDRERPVGTGHPGLLMAVSPGRDLDRLRDGLTTLAVALEAGDDDAVRAALVSLVPGYAGPVEPPAGPRAATVIPLPMTADGGQPARP